MLKSVCKMLGKQRTTAVAIYYVILSKRRQIHYVLFSFGFIWFIPLSFPLSL